MADLHRPTEDAGVPARQQQLPARKTRLFAVACCRRIWHLITDERLQEAVRVAERYADGLATAEELRAASKESDYASNEDDPLPESGPGTDAAFYGAYAAISTLWERSDEDVKWPLIVATLCLEAEMSAGMVSNPVDHVGPIAFLRDIFGNPFRPIPIDPAWLTWHDGTVKRIAQTAYDERHLPEGTLDKGRLAILADALEEAGCTDADILDHLRGPGPHVRGCWPVDLCLGKA